MATCSNKLVAAQLLLLILTGHAKLATLGTDRGAQTDAEARHGSTPRHFVSYYGYVETVMAVLEKRAHVTAASSNEETLLRLAADDVAALLRTRGEERIRNATAFFQQNGRADVAKILLEETGDVNARGSGRTPLHVASEKGHVDAVEVLLDRGASIEDKDATDGWDLTPLMWASREGHVHVVRVLLDRGARVDAKASYGHAEWTCLHFACQNNRVDVVRVLIDRGAPIDARASDNGNEWTPLHVASISGQLDAVKVLVDQGASVNAKDTSNDTPLARATQYGYYAVVAFLRSRGGTE